MWNHLESGRIGERPLDLFEKNGQYMIRVDGLELMNSHTHRSETALASIADDLLKSENPRILIGGLGIGYTLSAFIDQFGDDCEITVAEKSADVLKWYRQYFHQRLISFDDSGVKFVCTDVRDILESNQIFDLIVLDVDNGPEALSAASNDILYSREGLLQIRKRLDPNGALLIWSSFVSEEFSERARNSGFIVTRSCVPVGDGSIDHSIYVCSKA